jgi:hypothetical protein
MKFDQNEAGGMALEFLAWAINRDYSAVHSVFLSHFTPTLSQ